MNAPKFTPAPWNVSTPNCRGNSSIGIQRANAALIAASPELYAALERLVEKCDNTPLADDSCIDTLAAHAALAKARGETP